MRQSKAFVDVRKSVADPKIQKEFNVVVMQRQGSFVGGEQTKSDSAVTTESLINDPKHAWVKQLLLQLDEPKHSQTIYAAKIKNKITDQMLQSWSYKLDPQHYRRLYINKVYQDNFRTSQSISMSITESLAD